MPDIDAESAGILIESGVDVPTALAASIIEEPQPVRKLSQPLLWLALVGGVISAAVLWRFL